MKIFAYTPQQYDYETLEKTFIKKHIIDDIMKEISEKNCIVFGDWGVGKTHLLRLIYFIVKEKKEDNNWFVVSLGEMECGITNLAFFFHRVITEIINELSNLGEEIPNYLSESSEIYKYNNQVYIKKAISSLSLFIEEKKRKILLLVDNIDLIPFTTIKQLYQIKDEVFKVISILGSSSDVSFREKCKKFSLFSFIFLLPLSNDEVVDFIANWAKVTNEKKILSKFGLYLDYLDMIFLSSIYEDRGNPRILIFLFQIFQELSPEELKYDLISDLLFDRITPYLRWKMRRLSCQQRLIMNAMVEGEGILSKISSITKLKLNHVTAVMKTLINKGYCVKTKKGYDFCLPFFKKWYLWFNTAGKKRGNI